LADEVAPTPVPEIPTSEFRNKPTNSADADKKRLLNMDVSFAAGQHL